MSYIVLPHESTKIDWNNPISRGLVAAVNFNLKDPFLFPKVSAPFAPNGNWGFGVDKFGRHLWVNGCAVDFTDLGKKCDFPDGPVSHFGVVDVASIAGWSGIFTYADESLRTNFTLQKSTIDELRISRGDATQVTYSTEYSRIIAASGSPKAYMACSAGKNTYDSTKLYIGKNRRGLDNNTACGTQAYGTERRFRFFGSRDIFSSVGKYYVHLMWRRILSDAEYLSLEANPYQLFVTTRRPIYSLPSVNHWELQLKIGEAGEWTDVPNQPEDTQNFIKDSGLTNGDVYYARLRKFTNGVPSAWEISDPVTFTSESVSDERSVYAFWSSVPFIGISGVKEAFGVASLLSTPAVMAPGKKEAKGVTFLSASSTFLAIGKKEGKGTASLSSTLAIVAFGKKEGKGPLLVSSSSILTAVGKKEAKGPLTISFNAGQFVGLGKKEAKSQVFLSSTPAVGAFGIKQAKGPAYIVSSVVFGFDGIKAYVGLDKDGPGIFSASSVIGFGGRKESAGPLTIAQNNAIIADHLKEAFGPAYLSGNLEFYGMREEQVVPISLEEVLQVVKSSSRNKTAVSSVRKKSVLSTVRLKQVKSLKRT